MKITRLYISPEHNYFGHHEKPAGQAPSTACAEVEAVAGKGLRGDRFFGWKDDYKGQVTFFAEETWERLCEQLNVADKGPEVFRRNIITRGADLKALIGKEFEVQGVRFLGTQEAAPCYWMNQAFGEGAEKALHGAGGLRAKVLSDGILRCDG
jgi:hypothetical protein